MISFLLTTISSVILIICRISLAEENSCTIESAETEKRKNLILFDHNVYRSSIARGGSWGTDETYVTRGENMYKMEWSCDLEKQAALMVKYCPFTGEAPKYYALNYLFIENKNKYDLDNPYNLALKRWVRATEKKNFTAEYNGDYAILPFANMVRSNTTKVGCSEERCGNSSAVACLYNSPALKKGDAIYNPGNGCVIDSDCSTFSDSYCEVESNLCVKNKTMTAEEEMTYAGETTAALTVVDDTKKNRPTKEIEILAPEIGKLTMCPEVTGLTDALRDKVLRMQNSFRSITARGFVIKRNGHRLPPAANMRKLKYNCELEILSFTYASTCTFNTSDLLSRVQIGENIAAISVENATTFNEALEKGVNSWWNTLYSEINPLGNAAVFKKQSVKHRSLYFLQMIWAETQEVGCALVRCDEKFNLVCRGVQKGHQVYYPDEPCKKCPWHMRCEFRSGLCVDIEDEESPPIELSVMTNFSTLTNYFLLIPLTLLAVIFHRL